MFSNTINYLNTTKNIYFNTYKSKKHIYLLRIGKKTFNGILELPNFIIMITKKIDKYKLYLNNLQDVRIFLLLFL